MRRRATGARAGVSCPPPSPGVGWWNAQAQEVFAESRPNPGAGRAALWEGLRK